MRTILILIVSALLCLSCATTSYGYYGDIDPDAYLHQSLPAVDPAAMIQISPEDLTHWIHANVKYANYGGHRYEPQQVIEGGKANCVDQAYLLLSLIIKYDKIVSCELALVAYKSNTFNHMIVHVDYSNSYLDPTSDGVYDFGQLPDDEKFEEYFISYNGDTGSTIEDGRVVDEAPLP